MRTHSHAALITAITQLSAHDGPGLRTTLFFKGCSLQCQWCHNPETIHLFPQLEWDSTLCIGCRICTTTCKNNALNFSENTNFPFNHAKCVYCFSCTRTCPSKALNVVGKKYTLPTIMDLIKKDEVLIKTMDGGITFSGGEPVLQAGFISELSRLLKKKNFHLALDTCGQAPLNNYKQVLPFIDLLLFDIKVFSSIKHREFTGYGNQRILSNLYNISGWVRNRELSTRIWIRTPLIPGMTASAKNISGIGNLLNEQFSDVVDRWELCSFNNMCKDKYKRLGIDWVLEQVPLMHEKQVAELLNHAKQTAPFVKQIVATGLTEK